MRFEIAAAYAAGALLPLAEIARRRTDFSSITAYADDLIIGACLLVAARAASTRRPVGDALLVAAWGAVCGGLYYSFFGHLEHGPGTDISGLANSTVVALKGALYVVALAALALSIRSARASFGPKRGASSS